jgi:hypothetical protein
MPAKRYQTDWTIQSKQEPGHVSLRYNPLSYPLALLLGNQKNMRGRFTRSPTHLGTPAGRIGALVVCALVLNLAACEVGNAPPAMLHAVNSDNSSTADRSNAPSFTHPSPTPFNEALPVDMDVKHWLDEVQSDRLLITIDALAGMRTRHVLSVGFDPAQGIGITTARDYMIAQFHAIQSAKPLTVWTQPVTVTLNGVTATSDNVVAVAQGSDPTAGVIVVGAHYDSLNANNFSSADLPAPGANDNGSGVTALLEIARLLTASSQPRATVIFVAFTAEETGRQGSLAFVENYLRAQKPPIIPRAMLDLDTIGSNQTSDGQPGPNVLRVFSADPNDSPSRQLARQIQLAASAYVPAPQVIVQSSAERVGYFGDHQSFSDGGIAAVRLIEGSENPSQQRSSLDTSSDINPSYLMGVTRIALAALAILAAGPNAPQAAIWHASSATLTWSPVKEAAGYIVAARNRESAGFDWVAAVGADPTLTWSGLASYSFAAVAAVDAHGRMGALAPEINLTP